MMRKIYRGEVDKEKQQYLALCDSRVKQRKDEKKLLTFEVLYERMMDSRQLEIDQAKSSAMAPSPTNSEFSSASPRGDIQFGRRSQAFRENPSSTTNATIANKRL